MLKQRTLFVLVRHLRKLLMVSQSKEYSNAAAVNSKFDKALSEKYAGLPIPECKTLTDYVWIDGSGIHLRSKTRTLNCWPKSIQEVPQWHVDGAKTQQAREKDTDIRLLPVGLYKDPFRRRVGKIILCETYDMHDVPTPTNHRSRCCCAFNKTKSAQPLLGFEQEYMLVHVDGRPLGWPYAGGEMPPTGRYYCAVGASSSIGREIVEAHYKACLYAGVAIEGFNAEPMASKWKFHISPSVGIKGPDDVVVARYLLSRVAEEFGVEASFHPKLFPHKEGSAVHVNFSSKRMQEPDGINAIHVAAVKLCKKHEAHMKMYDPKHGQYNRYRLGDEFDRFSFGAKDRNFSVRIPGDVQRFGQGYLVDRRPASNSDPYAVCDIMLRTILLDDKDKDCDMR